jgi:hypothetical protein
VIAAFVALIAVLGVFAARVRYDHNLLNMQARGLDSVTWEMKLVEHTAGASWHALSYTASREEALALKARYEQLPVVSRVVEVASLVPADQLAKLDQLRDIRRRLRNLPQRGAALRPLLPSRAGTLQEEVQRLAHDLRSGQAPAVRQLCQELDGLSGQLAALPAGQADRRLREFDERLAGDLAEDLHRLREVSTPEPITTADLPPELRERYIGQGGRWLLRVFGKECLWEHEPLSRFVHQIQTVDPEATGKPFSTLEGLQKMKHGFQMGGLYALLVITLVLLGDCRRVGHTLLGLLPLGMGVILALGVMGLCGVPLNPANMIALPLIVGVGVDNGVHVLHDWPGGVGIGADPGRQLLPAGELGVLAGPAARPQRAPPAE